MLTRAVALLALALNILTLMINLSIPVDYIAHGMPRRDFSAFWTAGQILADHNGAQLYNLDTQKTFDDELPEGRFHPFLNPPHLAPLFATIRGPYHTASRIWAGLQIVLLCVLAVNIWQLTAQWKQMNRLLLLTTVLGSAVVGYGLAHGTLSLLMAIATFRWYRGVQSGQHLRPGLWLALATLKPQTVILPATLMIKRRATFVAFVTTCLASALIATALFGLRIWPNYLSMMRTVQGGEAENLIGTHTMPNLKGLLVLFGMTNTSALVIVGIALIGSVVLTAMSSKSGPLHMVFVLSLGLFLSPHLNIYDLSILALPAVVIYSHSRSRLFAWFAVGVPIFMNIAYLVGQGVLTVRLSQFYLPVMLCWAAYYIYKTRLSRLDNHDMVDPQLSAALRSPFGL